MIVACVTCARLDESTIAPSRLFNPGRCAACNGYLRPLATRGGWVAVDLDGVLAYHDPDARPYDGSIGPAVPVMVARVKEWIAAGYEVRVFTARIAPLDGESPESERIIQQHHAIHAFTVATFGYPLTVTCIKDRKMIEVWDDRAVQVQPNTGEMTLYQSSRIKP